MKGGRLHQRDRADRPALGSLLGADRVALPASAAALLRSGARIEEIDSPSLARKPAVRTPEGAPTARLQSRGLSRPPARRECANAAVAARCEALRLRADAPVRGPARQRGGCVVQLLR